MIPQPYRQPNETLLAYHFRLSEWDRLAKLEADRDAKAIDRALTKPKLMVSKTITRQTQLDRVTEHDWALTNSLLRMQLRKR